MAHFTGQCHCGKNTYQIEGEADFQFVCFCSDCRVLNGGGHLCGMMFDADKTSSLQSTSIYTYPGGSGQSIQMHFCSHCGTHLYGMPSAYPNKVVVKANTLTQGAFEPQQDIFKESAFAWDSFTTDSDN